MYEKFKSFLADDATFYALLLILIAVTSFGLGRQSTTTNNSIKNKPQITYTEQVAAPVIAVTESSVQLQTQVIGSRSGTKYHLVDCPGAKQIKETNKIFFDSVELAKAAGYTAAANCPGLQ